MKYRPGMAPRRLPAAAYDAQPVPADPSLLAALTWRKTMATRKAAAVRATPTAALVGSRYSGGASFAARSR